MFGINDNTDQPAYPVTDAEFEDGKVVRVIPFPGLSKREHAAIALRVPDSGDDVIDAMIRKANRMELAKAAMNGLISNWYERYKSDPETSQGGGPNLIASAAVVHADAILAELEKGAK